MDLLDFGLRPLRHYADFHGRSRRTELVYAYLLFMFVGIPASLLLSPLSPRAQDTVGMAVEAALLCPVAALVVRRLHDVGWSGWWTLLALPSFALSLFGWYQGYQAAAGEPVARVPVALGLPSGLCLFALVVLIAWRDEEGANRYGPNPRYAPAGETA